MVDDVILRPRKGKERTATVGVPSVTARTAIKLFKTGLLSVAVMSNVDSH